MIEKDYSKKADRLKILLKSQKIYDYMLDLMGVKFKNRLPPEESQRILYDTTRPELNDLPPLAKAEKINILEKKEKEELIQLLASSTLVRHYALLLAAVEYARDTRMEVLDQNIKKLLPARPYIIAQNKIRIPADKIKYMSLG